MKISRRNFLSGGTGLAAGVFAPGLSGLLGKTDESASRPPTPPNLDPDATILLKGGTILSMDDDVGDFESADILIQGSKIAEIGPDLAHDGTTIDASDMIVMPGFVDTHRHMWQGAIRNILPDGTLGDYMEHITGNARSVFRPQDAYIGDLVSALGAIDAGVTTVLDWSHIGNSPEHTDAAIEGLKASGIRGVYAYGVGTPGERNRFPDDIRRIRNGFFHSEDAMLTLALAAGINAGQWKLARDVGVRITVHVNGTGDLLPLADELGPDVTCIHCANLLDDEWQLLADSGTSVSIAAPIEMQMGHGTPPILKAQSFGIKPSISVDVETQMPGDFFTQMRSFFSLQRLQVQQQGDPERDRPRVPMMSVRDVVELATMQGARDNGLDKVTGSLTPGKKADIILLRKNRINVTPVNNPYGAVVLGMDTGNVDTVFINGVIKKWKGTLVDVDFDRIRSEVVASRDHIVSNAGWPKQSDGSFIPSAGN